MAKNNWRLKGNDFKPNKRIWDEYVNDETGESTTEKLSYQKSSTFDTCDHYYELIDNNSNFQCQKCGLGGRLVWGKKFLKDGKIVNQL